MTKKEIIEALKDYPDDMLVCIKNEYSDLSPIHHVGLDEICFTRIKLESISYEPTAVIYMES